MATAAKAPGRASMHLDTRIPEGHVVVCRSAGEEHSFLVTRLDAAVECPVCGRKISSTDLVDDYYDRALSLLRLAYGSALGDAERKGIALDGDTSAEEISRTSHKVPALTSQGV
jgi:hypothetical protein